MQFSPAPVWIKGPCVCVPSARCRLVCSDLAMPASAMQQVKRAFVTAINALAGRHGVEVHISCDSPDAGLRSAYRQVLFRVHPDRCGNGEEQKRLNAAHDTWVQAVTAPKGRGRPHAARCGGADVGGSDAMTMLLPTEQGQPRQEHSHPRPSPQHNTNPQYLWERCVRASDDKIPHRRSKSSLNAMMSSSCIGGSVARGS